LVAELLSVKRVTLVRVIRHQLILVRSSTVSNRTPIKTHKK
jgi:hypothetical protein